MNFPRRILSPEVSTLRSLLDKMAGYLTGTPIHDYQLAIVKPKGLKVRVLAFLSYLSILCLIPLIFAREDSFLHFHARQGLVLWLWGLLAIVALHIPGLGPFLSGISVVFILFFSCVGMISVLFSKQWKMPMIGGLAAKL